MTEKPPTEIEKIPASSLSLFFDLLLAVKPTFAQQKRPTYTAGYAVIPAGDSWVDKLGTCNRHGCFAFSRYPRPPNR